MRTLLFIGFVVLLALPVFAQSDVLTDDQKEELYKQIGKERGEQILKDAETFRSGQINFWGIVVDEKGKPIEGAKVHFEINNYRMDWYREQERPKFEATSDAKGMFSLVGKKGGSLEVEVSKEGYYETKESGDTFDYGDITDEASVAGFPTPQKPAIFVLRKKGEAAALIPIACEQGIGKEGKPVEITLGTGKAVSTEQGDLKVEFWSEGPTAEEKHQLLLKGIKLPHFLWRCRITAPGGGFLPRIGKYDFQAPAEGYQETVEISMLKETERWLNQGEKELFVKTGNQKFARIRFVICAEGNPTPFFDIHGYFNPSGSRNLEWDENKAIKPGK